MRRIMLAVSLLIIGACSEDTTTNVSGTTNPEDTTTSEPETSHIESRPSERHVEEEATFQRIVEMFEQGRKPTKEEFRGLRKGLDFHHLYDNKHSYQQLICEDYDLDSVEGSKFGCSNIRVNTAYYRTEQHIKDEMIPAGKKAIREFDLEFNFDGDEVCNENLTYLFDMYQGTECYRVYGDYLLYMVKLPENGFVTRVGYFEHAKTYEY